MVEDEVAQGEDLADFVENNSTSVLYFANWRATFVRLLC